MDQRIAHTAAGSMSEAWDVLWKVIGIIFAPIILFFMNRQAKRSDDNEARLSALEKNTTPTEKVEAMHAENQAVVRRFEDKFDRFAEENRKDRHDMRETMHTINVRSAEDRVLLRQLAKDEG